MHHPKSCLFRSLLCKPPSHCFVSLFFFFFFSPSCGFSQGRSVGLSSLSRISRSLKSLEACDVVSLFSRSLSQTCSSIDITNNKINIGFSFSPFFDLTRWCAAWLKMANDPATSCFCLRQEIWKPFGAAWIWNKIVGENYRRGVCRLYTHLLLSRQWERALCRIFDFVGRWMSTVSPPSRRFSNSHLANSKPVKLISWQAKLDAFIIIIIIISSSTWGEEKLCMKNHSISNSRGFLISEKEEKYS